MEMRLSVIRTLARWGFRFARLLSRVNARPFRFVTLLRVNASVFWQNGMEVRLSLIRTLARWGFRFARLLSRVNARPFRFITLLRVNASVFLQNGMEVRLSLITASRSPRTLTMCRIIDNPRANESGSSIPFGLALSRKRPAPPERTAIPEKPRRSGPKRNPSPARERNIESTALPLTCALARLHPFDTSAEWNLAAQFLEPVTTNTGMSEIYVLLPPF